MTTQKVVDAALIDAISGYCALNNVGSKTLNRLPFIQVVQRLAEVCQLHPQWVEASREVRRYYPICHEGCHTKRIQAFMRNGCEWRPGTGPEEPHYDNNVVEFPSNSTKH